MTRLAIVADIHGNLPALEAVIKDMVQYQVDQVIVAGDVVGFGPFSEAVLERITELRWPVIRGSAGWDGEVVATIIGNVTVDGSNRTIAAVQSVRNFGRIRHIGVIHVNHEN